MKPLRGGGWTIELLLTNMATLHHKYAPIPEPRAKVPPKTKANILDLHDKMYPLVIPLHGLERLEPGFWQP